jgi:hypothetical protein
MNILLGLIIGSAWAFYEALILDRPDLAAVIHDPYATIIHIAFAAFFLGLVFVLSWQEMHRPTRWWITWPKIYLRNTIVMSLGVVLLIYGSRILLNGIDPTGHRAVW